MSLVSQTWFPTSVQVTVHQARGLRVKGKNGTNDTYAIIQVAKDKFSTSVAEKSVFPVWKEEASFDLPLFHLSNAERCTLYIVVMHRSHVGLDRFLGQAVVNLLELFDNKSLKKTDWFKLVDKTGKEDKPRGDVLLDIQFMKNHMSASMLDLSMRDKPGSRISKLKEKVRRKKKDGFSDSASAIVSSSSHVLTDSEGEADTQSLSQSSGVKKKSKLKTLFAPKSNLQRNVSQSLSTLRTFPEKNSSFSGSHSSGLNGDSPEVKKTFKFHGHKQIPSSDSRISHGPVTLLGDSKQINSDLNNLCINGSHVYTENTKTSSNVSLKSIGQGSLDDVLKHTSDADKRHVSSMESDKEILEQQCYLRQEEKRQGEEKCIAEAKIFQEEEKYRQEGKRLKEEEDGGSHEEQEKRCTSEDNAHMKKQREEKEESRKQEEELKMLELAENQKIEEECCREEEQKPQEEISMNERLTSLFGIIRKKEEDLPQDIKDEPPTQAPLSDYSHPFSHYSTNPFEDIPLNSDPVGTGGSQKASISHQIPSGRVFLNRTAKVSAVKPRLTQSQESEPYDCKFFSDPCPSVHISESSVSFVQLIFLIRILCSVDSPLAPPDIQITPFGSFCDNPRNIAFVLSSANMAEKKRALLAPSYQVQATQNGGKHIKVKEISNPVYEEEETSQQGKKMTIPLPDYETLFPQKRHGVQGHTQWDHIIAEVNQKHIDTSPKFVGKEMSVDGPEQYDSTIFSPQQTNSSLRYYRTKPQETKVATSQKAAPQIPTKTVIPPDSQTTLDSSQQWNQCLAQSPIGPSSSAVQRPVNTYASSRDVSVRSTNEAAKVSQSSVPVSQQTGQMNAFDTQTSDDHGNIKLTRKKNAPTAKPRQKINGNQLHELDAAITPVVSLSSLTSNTSISGMDKNGQWTENFAVFDPFPSTGLLKDPWTQLTNNQQDSFTGGGPKEQKLEDCGMTVEDLNDIFTQTTQVDPFANLNGIKLNRHDDYEEDSKDAGLFFKRRQNHNLASTNQSNQTLKSCETLITRPDLITGARNSKIESPQKPQADEETLNAVGRRADPFGTQPIFVIPPRTFSDSLQVVIEEPAECQAESGSGGKTPLRAQVSPSEVQPLNTHNSSGSGQVFFQRRPHPVKPMSSAESQHPISTPTVPEVNIRDSTARKTRVTDTEIRPYIQLTQEELITLVVKQQSDLSRKDAKIVQLEEYIDNLLVRVIEEKPSILQCLKVLK